MRIMANLSVSATLFTTVFISSGGGQSTLPASDLPRVASMLEKDFGSIYELQTVGMTETLNGRFDLIAAGKGLRGGWKVEAIAVDHHSIRKIFDSGISVTEPEFEVSSASRTVIHKKKYDYDLLISGCARHLCFDGVHGFLIFSGQSRQIYKAKVVTEGLDHAFVLKPKYDVTLPKDISESAQLTLQEAICTSNMIGNKPGLPFKCELPIVK